MCDCSEAASCSLFERFIRLRISFVASDVPETADPILTKVMRLLPKNQRFTKITMIPLKGPAANKGDHMGPSCMTHHRESLRFAMRHFHKLTPPIVFFQILRKVDVANVAA